MKTPILFIALSLTFSSIYEARAVDCTREAGTLPHPRQTAGTPDPTIPVDHIVMLMQENHSFDSYFGRLAVDGYPGQVEGVGPHLYNIDAQGKTVAAFHQTKVKVDDIGHSWEDQHAYWNEGRNDGFAAHGGARAMGYYERSELPYYYALANEFAIADHYHCALLGPTFPNRFFLLAGTAFGHVKNVVPQTLEQAYTQKTIFDVLDANGISWKYYSDWSGYLPLFGKLYLKSKDKLGTITDFDSDAREGKLPSIAFLDSEPDEEDEHPPADVQVGQTWVAARVETLRKSPLWKKLALFFTYDENGGFYDHVPPPQACIPDDIPPSADGKPVKGAYDRYGFRVPFMAISHWAKKHYVSHRTYDHTSILKFIEIKFNLPALSRRDANADGLMDLFDFGASPQTWFDPSPLSYLRFLPKP